MITLIFEYNHYEEHLRKEKACKRQNDSTLLRGQTLYGRLLRTSSIGAIGRQPFGRFTHSILAECAQEHDIVSFSQDCNQPFMKLRHVFRIEASPGSVGFQAVKWSPIIRSRYEMGKRKLNFRSAQGA